VKAARLVLAAVMAASLSTSSAAAETRVFPVFGTESEWMSLWSYLPGPASRRDAQDAERDGEGFAVEP